MLYLAFDYILGMIRGKFVYGILEMSDVNLGVILLVIAGMYLVVLLVAFLTRYVNEKLYFNIEKNNMTTKAIFI